MILGSIVLGLVGALLIIIGYLIGVKEKINLLHDYHYAKVKQEDKKVFCTLCGIGLALIGVGILISGVIFLLTESLLSFIGCAIGFTLGIAIIIYAEKYNR